MYRLTLAKRKNEESAYDIYFKNEIVGKVKKFFTHWIASNNSLQIRVQGKTRKTAVEKFKTHYNEYLLYTGLDRYTTKLEERDVIAATVEKFLDERVGISAATKYVYSDYTGYSIACYMPTMYQYTQETEKAIREALDASGVDWVHESHIEKEVFYYKVKGKN
jgi:hypothetical protein